MLFNSWAFLLFFLVVLLIVWRLDHPRQNLFLLAASYFFYGCWDWRFLGLLLFTTTVDYFCALKIETSKNPRPSKRFLLISLVTNVAVLGFFKYFNFFMGSIAQMTGMEYSVWKILLPVGISFYTFQSMSYTMDVFRGHVKPMRKFSDYALYVSFFPQLVAGPIERSTALLPQILSPRQMTRQGFQEGLYRVVLGFVKKIFIADNLAPIVNMLFAKTDPLTGWETLLAVYAFSFQIYADFSGYTDIARGTARLLGFRLRLNFDLPYFSRSPREFWRRWHISLSTWLRDYLYIPLGGSRQGEFRTSLNLLTTMVLGGLWHGASWTFVVWGGYHGTLLIFQRLWNRCFPTVKRQLGHVDLRMRAWLQMIGMFHLAGLGWLFFRAESLHQVGRFLKALTGSWQMDWVSFYYFKEFFLFTGFLIIGEFFEYVFNDRRIWLKMPVWVKTSAAGVLTAWGIMLYAMGIAGSNKFIYFQF